MTEKKEILAREVQEIPEGLYIPEFEVPDMPDGWDGSEMLVIVDKDTILGEVESITWDEEVNRFKDGSAKGTITCTTWDSEPLEKYLGKSFDIWVTTANINDHTGEYNGYWLQGVEITKRRGRIAIGETIKCQYEFTARHLDYFPEFTMNIDQQLNYVYNNEVLGQKDKLDSHTRKLISFYKEWILFGMLHWYRPQGGEKQPFRNAWRYDEAKKHN